MKSATMTGFFETRNCAAAWEDFSWTMVLIKGTSREVVILPLTRLSWQRLQTCWQGLITSSPTLKNS